MGYAIIHEKLCDNYVKCPAMLNCVKKQSAIYLSGNDSDPDRRILIDRDKCIGCGDCIDYCGLFRIATNQEAEKDLRAEFAQDPRNNVNFQEVERFGCDVFDIGRYRLNTIDSINAYIVNSPPDQYDLLEFVDDEHLFCAFQGISVRRIIELFPEQLKDYRKYVVQQDLADDIFNIYGISNLPAILLLRGGLIVGSIYGRYCVNHYTEEQEMFQALKEQFSTLLNTEAI